MNDTFLPSLLLHTCLLWWLYATCLKIDKLHHPCNDNTRAMQKHNAVFFWVTNFRQKRPSLLFFSCVRTCHACYVAHTCFLIVVGKCRLTQFPQKQNNKSGWCWQRWLCNWVAQLMKLQSFQGICWSRVSDSYLTSFLPQTCNGVQLHQS